MKRINQYFIGSCIAFTTAIIITIIMHLMNNKSTINVNSEIFLILVIIIENTILYFLENLKVKSQAIHITLEFIVIVIMTFFIGIPMKVIEIGSIYDFIEVIFIIAVAYGITILSIYKSIQKDAEDINKKLLEK